MMRRLAAPALAAALVCGSLVAAASPAAAGTQSVADGTHDNANGFDAHGDVTNVALKYEDGTIHLGADVVTYADPTNTPAWVDWLTSLAFGLDTNGDGQPEYVVIMINDGSGQVLSEVFTYPAGTDLCAATPAWGSPPNDDDYSVSFPASCIGAPASVAAGAQFEYMTGPAAAQDSFDETGWTAPTSNTTTTVDSVPPAPLNVMATGGNASATVTWDPVPDTGISPVTSYTVHAVGGAQTAVVDGNTTSAVVTGLTNGALYTFTVTATNAIGDSAPSAPSGFVIPRATVPGPPTAVAAKAGNGLVTVTWGPPTDVGGGPVTRYVIQSGPRTLVTAGSVRRTTLNGLTNGVTYTIKVLASNAFGDGPFADPVTATPHGLPAAPGNVHAVAAKTSATVTWTPPADDGGTPITGYLVTANPGGPHVAVAPNATSVKVNLDPGHYSFTVAAKNAIGLGARAVSNPFDIAQVVQAAHHHAGYWMLGRDGTTYAFGAAQKLTTFSSAPEASATAISPRADGSGYWVAFADGTVRAYGTARWYGDAPVLPAGEHVTTISGTPAGDGYWLFTNRGRAIPCGSARFYGDMHTAPLNGPIVASVSTPSGHGYYLVGSDGGIFTFGDAQFHGSTGALRLNRPVVGIAPTPDGRGYWLVASDGGVFAFGARFRGSMGGTRLNSSVNGLVAFGNGYLMVASDGGVFDFSDTPFLGSLASHPPASPIVGIAAFTS